MDEGLIKKTPCIFKKLIHRAYEKKKGGKKKEGKHKKNTWEFFLLGLSLLRDLKDLSRIRVRVEYVDAKNQKIISINTP